MARIKYIRVSTREQNTARQETDMEKFDRVYIEKASGKNAERPELKAMLETHARLTGSAKASSILSHWTEALSAFKMVIPTEYRRAMEGR